jgi:biopolymer transport protein ExbB
LLESILETVLKTGWVLAPLLFSSLLGWFLIIHRGLALRRLTWPREREARMALANDVFPAWAETLTARDARTAVGSAVAAVYAVRDQGREAMESKLDEVMKMQVPELERFLSTVAILASAAPLIGLLGTVTGMVRTFEVISAFGTGNQSLMSESIAEALLATQNGLLVAFPLLILHMQLASRARALEDGALSLGKILINRFGRENP